MTVARIPQFGQMTAVAVPGGSLSPDPRWARLQTEDGKVSVTARLVDVTLIGGGGVDSVGRPQRKPLSTYTGGSQEGMTLELLFDGYATGTSVHSSYLAIGQMAGAFFDVEPAKLIVSGPAIPHGAEHASQNRWKISAPPEWGDKIRNEQGELIRQYVTLTLLLVVESNALERVKPRAGEPAYKLATAKAGDTFEKIAKRELGSQRLAQKLRRLNVEQGVAYFKNWRSVDKAIREGTQVRLPTAGTLKLWKADLKAGR